MPPNQLVGELIAARATLSHQTVKDQLVQSRLDHHGRLARHFRQQFPIERQPQDGSRLEGHTPPRGESSDPSGDDVAEARGKRQRAVARGQPPGAPIRRRQGAVVGHRGDQLDHVERVPSALLLEPSGEPVPFLGLKLEDGPDQHFDIGQREGTKLEPTEIGVRRKGERCLVLAGRGGDDDQALGR